MSDLLGFATALYGLYADEETPAGQGLVEYALILSFVALVVLVSVFFLKDQILTGYSRIGNSIPTS